MSKHFGVATYKALRLGDHAILIIASGFAPNFTTRVSIEQLPWRIFPPQFGLFFDEPPISLPALKPFTKTGVFAYPRGVGTVTIVDAGGPHVVDVVGEIDLMKFESVDDGQFLVYQWIGRSSCIVVPEDALVPAVYTRVFGPAKQTQCQAWALAHCGK